MSDRVFRASLGAAAVVGVALRLFHIRRYHTGDVAFGDAETYRLLAGVLADGEGYIRPRALLFEGERVATAEFPPLWPMLLAALDLIGLDGASEQRALGALLGGVTIVVVGLLATSLADRRVGILAAALTAAHPQLVVLDTSLLAEGLAVALVSTALLGVVRARAADGGPLGAEGRRWWLLAAVALGLGALTRSEIVLLAVVLVVPACRVPDRRVWARTAALGLAGVAVCVGGWTIRNAISLDVVQPFTNNSGTLIAGANCDAVYGGSQIGLWRLDCVTALDTAGLDESAASSQRRSAGVEYALDHITDLPAVGTVRILRTFGAWDIRSQLFFESLEGRDYDWLWAGWFAWLGLAAAAIGGMARADRDGWRACWPLVVPLSVVVFTALVSYGNSRFRAVAEPGVIVLAAIGVVACSTDAVRAGKRLRGRRSARRLATRPPTSRPGRLDPPRRDGR
ncbi:MAG: glycosyltransferase family 39 protein [Actinomycetota bacterium]